MNKCVIGFLSLMHSLPGLASINNCTSDIKNYKILKDSLYPFNAGKDKSCFFAFYTNNPDPISDARGNGNIGDSLWYAYYRLNEPHKIYEFPKPSDTFWGSVCSLEAVSFQAMYGNGKRNVTVIGGCNKYNAINYNTSFVFTWKNDKYVLDEDVYSGLFGVIGLTVADVRNYIKKPDLYYDILHHRYDSD